MYAHFTDRARKVMKLAEQDARRLNHQCIGTGHILVGLLKERSGVAVQVLRNHSIDMRSICQIAKRIVWAGPDLVQMWKQPTTLGVKKTIECSLDEARKLDHYFVDTEHLLLGLLTEQESVANQILAILGIKLDAVRQEIIPMQGVETALPAKKTAKPRKARGLGRSWFYRAGLFTRDVMLKLKVFLLHERRCH